MSREASGLDISLNNKVQHPIRRQNYCGLLPQPRVRIEMVLLVLVAAAFCHGQTPPKPFDAGPPAPRLAKAKEAKAELSGGLFASQIGDTGGASLSKAGPRLDPESPGQLLKDAAVVVICLLAASLLGFAPTFLRLARQNPAPPRAVLSLVRRPISTIWRAQENERKQLSRELHDSVGQVLTAAGMELAALRSTPLPQDQMQERLNDVSRLNAEALRMVRDLAMGLRPALLDDVGLAAALDWQVRQFSRRTRILSSLDLSGDLDGLPETHRICIYRCVQEALTNCAKHSRARNLRLVISAAPGTVSVTIEDDGVGCNLVRHPGSGLGILGMRERVAGLGGRLDIASRRGAGTALCFDLPVPVEVQV